MWGNGVILCLVLCTLCYMEVTSGNGIKRCRPLSDHCISMRSGFEEPVKLIVGSRPTNRFLKIGGINSLSDVGHSGLTEFVDSPDKVAKDSFTPDNTSVILFRSGLDSFQVDHDRLVSQLMTASKLRDNIVTFTGYILYKPNSNFTFALYGALQLIYESFKSRSIDTTKLISVLSDIEFEQPHNQFLSLLRKLEKICPVTLKCSVKLWKETLSNKQIDLNQIVCPNGGPGDVDLLSGIDVHSIKNAKKVIDFGDLDENDIDSPLKEIISPLLTKTVAAISVGSLSLTQPIFAMILNHLPYLKFHPEVEEANRYLIDTLKDNYLISWNKVSSNLEDKDLTCPFMLVTEILKRIACPTFEMNVRVQEAAEYLLPTTIPPTLQYMNEYQPVMTEILIKPKLDIVLLLKYLNVEVFPPDIADCKVRLIKATNSNILDKYSILFGFMRFQYSTPEDLFIGITHRIRRRYFDLDSEVMDSVKSLNAYVSFKKSYAPFSNQPPKGFIDVTLLIEAFFSPSLPKEITTTSKKLLKNLEQVTLPWNSLLIEIKSQYNTSPRSIFLNILKHIISNNLISNSSVVDLMKKFVSKLDKNGEPLAGEKDMIDPKSIAMLNCPNYSSKPGPKFKLDSHNDTNSILGFLDKTTKSFQEGKINVNNLKQIYCKLLKSIPVQQNSYIYETIKVNLAKLDFENETTNDLVLQEKKEEMEALPDYAELSNLLPHLKNDKNDTLRSSLVQVLNSSELPVLLGPNFIPCSYSCKADLLQAILNHLLHCTCPGVSNKPTVIAAIKLYQKRIHIHGLGSQRISWRSVNRQVDFAKLLEELIDYDHLTDEIKDAYDYFVYYIANGTTFQDLIFGFNSFVWKNKHDYTVGVMLYMISNKEVPDEFVKNVKLLTQYVTKEGVGLEQPDYKDIVNGGANSWTSEYKKDDTKNTREENILNV